MEPEKEEMGFKKRESLAKKLHLKIEN